MTRRVLVRLCLVGLLLSVGTRCWAQDAEQESESKPTRSNAKSDAAKSPTPDSASEDDDNTAAALGAANPVVAANTGKPWQLMGSLGFSLGSSTFSQNQQEQATLSLSAIGLYRISPLFEGRLDALVRVAGDATLVEGYTEALGATSPNQVFFRDVRIGVLGRGLYKWKDNGFTFGANTTFDLPTSEQAQFFGRIFRWNLGVNVVNMIPKVGPGNLLFTAFFTFRKDVGEVNPSVPQEGADGSRIAVCRTSNQTDAGNCYSDLAPLNFAFLYGTSLRYFLGSFSLGASITLLNNFNHDLGDSELSGDLVAGVPAEDVGSSPEALDAPNHVLLTFIDLSATYVFSSNFNMSAGVNSFQVPIRYQDGNPRAVVSPLFDSPERNATTVYVNAAVML